MKNNRLWSLNFIT